MGLYPTLFGSIILILFSYIVFTPKAANVTISVSPDFKLKHIRQGNCKNSPGVIEDGNSEYLKDNLNRTALASEDFRYTSKKHTYSRTRNTFIMTDHRTVDEISKCIASITLNKRSEWKQGKFSDSKDLLIMKDYFSLCPQFNVKQMYLALMTNIDWSKFPDYLDFTCYCHSNDFNISISLYKVKNKNKKEEYIINHYSGQDVNGTGSICH
jgi:hypothetical protein